MHILRQTVFTLLLTVALLLSLADLKPAQAANLVQIGSTNYASWAEVVAAVYAGDTITLLQDVTFTDGDALPAVACTIDGGPDRHTLKLKGTGASPIKYTHLQADTTFKDLQLDDAGEFARLDNVLTSYKVQIEGTVTTNKLIFEEGPELTVNGSLTCPGVYNITKLTVSSGASLNVTYYITCITAKINGTVETGNAVCTIGFVLGNATHIGLLSGNGTIIFRAAPTACIVFYNGGVTPDASITLQANGYAPQAGNILIRNYDTIPISNLDRLMLGNGYSAFQLSGAVNGVTYDYTLARAMSINDVTSAEGNSGTTTFTYAVSLSAPADAGGVSFDIATADNTAIASSDYTAKSLTGQIIPAGSSTYNFNVLVNGDTDVESNENFYVNINNVTGAVIKDGQGLGTITNDDYAVTFAANNVPANGITATASPISNHNAGDTVSTTVTLSGTAQSAGIHTIGLTSAKAGTITAPTTVIRSVASGESPTDTYTFTFIMPSSAVDDLVVTNIFSGQTITSVTVSPQTATLTAAGTTSQLNAVVAGTGGAAQTVTWSSNNTAVASVSNTGLVTAIANGTAAITATSTVDNTKSDTAAITVTIPSSASNSGSGGSSTTKADLVIDTDSGDSIKLTAAELANIKDLTVKGQSASLTLSTDLLTAFYIKSSLEVIIKPVKSEELSEPARAMIGTRPVFNLIILADGKAVNNTGNITIEIPYLPRAGENTSQLAAFEIAADGTITQVEGSHYDSAKKAVVFTTSHISIYAIGLKEDQAATGELEDTNQAIKFTDVASGHWAEKAIYYLAGQGVITGKTAAAFAPDDKITRAELVTILAKISRKNTPQGTAEFSDVSANDWFALYVAWANQAGVARGYNRQFRPNDYISRQDMAVMLQNYANQAGYTLPKRHEAVVFADDSSISGYARSAAYALQQAGIISGQSGNIFAPQAGATRAEAAQMIAGLMQDMAK